MQETTIIMLPAEQLHPHPQNPRDDLGDLTELSGSIAKNGIMQNLTVVKDGGEMKKRLRVMLKTCRDAAEKTQLQERMDAIDSGRSYTVIIGHRRLAASKLAGLKELPCAVVKMGERQQLETMLSENMLREELTIAKQVNAFCQLSFLGATAGEIADATGFSESTIQRRIRYGEKIGTAAITAAEQNAVKAGRQLTLDELDKICGITDDEIRKTLSAELGTQNFNYRYQQAKQAEENAKNRALFSAICDNAGVPLVDHVGYRAGWDSITVMYEMIPRKKCETLDDVFTAAGKRPPEKARLYRTETAGTWGTITWKRPESEEDKQMRENEQEKEQERLQRMGRLKAAFKAAYESRREFVENDDLIMAEVPDVMRFLIDAATEESVDWEQFAELCGYDSIQYDDFLDVISSEYDTERCRSALKTMKRHCFFIAYSAWNDNEALQGVDNFGRFHPEWGGAKELNRLYEYLEKFGYDISNDEAELLDGSSELYLHDAEDVGLE